MTAKLVARNDPRAYEWTHGDTIEPTTYVEWLHPPAAKYAQAVTILFAGENAVGWRLSSVFFGVGVVLLTALLAHRLFKSPWLSVLAGGLVALDGLLLTQSRIAMNDIHVVFGFLVTLYAYVWYRQQPKYWRLVVVGFCIGLTLATKWSGVFAWASILLFEFLAIGWSLIQLWFRERRQWLRWMGVMIKQLTIRLVTLGVLPLFIYFASYVQMYSHGKDLAYFIELHQQILYYQFHLEATHPYQSRPLEWIIDLRPVWYFVDYLPDGRRADIYNVGNPFIFLGGLAASLVSCGTLLFIVFRKMKNRFHSYQKTAVSVPQTNSLLLSCMKVPPTRYFALSLLLLTYLLCWVPWLVSPRIMFFYHYAPAVPLMTIMTAYWWQFYWVRGTLFVKVLLLTYLILTTVFFCLWYPHWVGIPISSTFKDAVYFIVPSWK